MQTSPSHSPTARHANLDHQRIFRAAVLNSVPVPAETIAALEARGIDYSALEARILQNMEFRR